MYTKNCQTANLFVFHLCSYCESEPFSLYLQNNGTLFVRYGLCINNECGGCFSYGKVVSLYHR